MWYHPPFITVCCKLGILPVAHHDMLALDADLALLAGPEGDVVFIHDLDPSKLVAFPALNRYFDFSPSR